MEQPTVVTRTLDLDMSPDELWFLIGDRAGWADWMVDDADVVIEPGAEGTVTDGGTHRGVRVTDVVDGERVTFDWWPSGDEHAGSAVELIVTPADEGSVLRVVETFAAPRHVAVAQASAASTAWSVRAVGLWLCCRSLVTA